MVDLFNLTELRPSERLWLWRRRQRSERNSKMGRGGGHMSQIEAAALLGVTHAEYTRLENGGYENLLSSALASFWDDLNLTPTVAEQCALARRRSGQYMAPLQAAVGGVSKPTFVAMERSGHPDIVALWQSRGYRFNGG